MQLGKARRASIGAMLALGCMALDSPAFATINVQSNGQDGPLNITTSTVIDLSNPTVVTDAAWDAATPNIGAYDANQWAIVFHYTSVNIASGATLTFINHPKNAPVVWLVNGSVTVTGTISISGGNGAPNASETPGGPGGFQGGRGRSAGGTRGHGFGPGGGRDEGGWGGSGSFGTPGSYSGPLYGTWDLMPLIGGSGGGGGNYNLNDGSGGGGGGAIMIAAANEVILTGTVRSNGGNGYDRGSRGSGGAIKIVADRFSGSGTGALRALGGDGGGYEGGAGRIAVLVNADDFVGIGSSDPAYTSPPLTNPPQLWPTTTTPAARVIEIAGVAVPADPLASLTYPLQDILINSTGDVAVRIETRNVPQESVVSVFVTKSRGNRIDPPIVAAWQSGSPSLGYWTATVSASSLTNGSFAIQARAVLP